MHKFNRLIVPLLILIACFLCLIAVSVGYYFVYYLPSNKEKEPEQAQIIDNQSQEKDYETLSAECAGKGIQEMTVAELEEEIYKSCYVHTNEVEEYIACTGGWAPDYNKEVDKELQTTLCIGVCDGAVNEWYQKYWDDRCKEQGKLERCLLDSQTANAIEKRYNELTAYCDTKKYEL